MLSLLFSNMWSGMLDQQNYVSYHQKSFSHPTEKKHVKCELNCSHRIPLKEDVEEYSVSLYYYLNYVRLYNLF